jgi:uncharacterized protein YneF (UPF0154 family)
MAMDVLVVALTFLFFVICGVYVAACDQMSRDHAA